MRIVEISTTEKYSVVQQEGNREIKRNILHYKWYALKAVEILNKINQKPSNLSTKGLWNKVQYIDKKHKINWSGFYRINGLKLYLTFLFFPLIHESPFYIVLV